MAPLEITRLTLLVIHFVGLAILIGPFLLQALSAEAPRLRLMLIGAIVQIVTGNALIASNRLHGNDVDEFKMIVKLGISVAVLGMLLVAAVMQRRKGADAGSVRPVFQAAGGLALVNVIIAVVWR